MSKKQETVSEVTWTASEYVEHTKSSMWYLALAIITILVSTGVYFLTKEWFAPVAISVALLGLGVFATVKPKEKVYTVDSSGITVGEDHFFYQNFRSFSVVFDGVAESIYVKPLKRFAVPLTIYFPPEQGDEIINLMGEFIPYEKVELAGVDKMMAKLKF